VKPQHGNRRWVALVLPIVVAASSTTTTLFSVLPSAPPLLLPPMLAKETDSRYTQLRAIIMDVKFLSKRKKENFVRLAQKSENQICYKKWVKN
jgi:hypothetical protein